MFCHLSSSLISIHALRKESDRRDRHDERDSHQVVPEGLRT